MCVDTGRSMGGDSPLTAHFWLAADITGARVDNLEYLAEHNIDRNLVSKELSRVRMARQPDLLMCTRLTDQHASFSQIFSQMVYLNGCERPARLLQAMFAAG